MGCEMLARGLCGCVVVSCRPSISRVFPFSLPAVVPFLRFCSLALCSHLFSYVPLPSSNYLFFPSICLPFPSFIFFPALMLPFLLLVSSLLFDFPLFSFHSPNRVFPALPSVFLLLCSLPFYYVSFHHSMVPSILLFSQPLSNFPRFC